MSESQRVVFFSVVNKKIEFEPTAAQMGLSFCFPTASPPTLDQATIYEATDSRVWTDGFRPTWRAP